MKNALWNLSGYEYWCRDISYSFTDEQKYGNFILAKTENNKLIPLYIGQGNLHCVKDDIHYSNAKKMGALYILVHLNEDEEMRRKEMREILAKHPEAYAPNVCNEKDDRNGKGKR